MNFASWQAFWHMGGYGVYVWSAYGFILLSALVFAFSARIRLQRLKKRVKQTHESQA